MASIDVLSKRAGIVENSYKETVQGTTSSGDA